jgi:hypothetical protein
MLREVIENLEKFESEIEKKRELKVKTSCSIEALKSNPKETRRKSREN